MDLAALADLGRYGDLVRTTAAQCRGDAEALRRCARELAWQGLSGSACREAILMHARSLEAAADQLEVAAVTLRAHASACQAVLVPVGVAAGVMDLALAVLP